MNGRRKVMGRLGLWLLAGTLAGSLAATGSVYAKPGKDKKAPKHDCAQPCDKCPLHGGADAGGPGADLGKLKKHLGLTDEQTDQVKAVFKDMKGKREALKQEVESGALDEAKARERHEALKKEREERISAILTPEQREKAEKLKKKMEKAKGFAEKSRSGKGRGKETGKKSGDAKRGPEGAGQRLSAVMDKLQLTDAQREKAKDAIKKHLAEGEQLRLQMKNSSTPAAREQTRKLMEEHRDRLRSELSAILTAEQQRQLEEMLEKKRLERDSDSRKGARPFNPDFGPVF